MKLNDFIKKWKGKNIDFDKSYWFQCKDLINQYTKEVYNFDAPKWNAYKVYFSTWEWFTKHKNTPLFNPKPWDICVWKKGKYWHIAIVVKANLIYLDVLEQNGWNGNWSWYWDNAIRIKRYYYKNVYWFMRKKEIEYTSKILWKDIIKNWYTYPSFIHWIPIILINPKSKTLLWYAGIKWISPNSKRDIIYITHTLCKKWYMRTLETIHHEFAHFVYYRWLTDVQKIFVENLYKFSPHYLTKYSKKNYLEEFAEVQKLYLYLNDKRKVPNYFNYSEWVIWKYKILNEIYLRGYIKMKNL